MQQQKSKFKYFPLQSQPDNYSQTEVVQICMYKMQGPLSILTVTTDIRRLVIDCSVVQYELLKLCWDEYISELLSPAAETPPGVSNYKTKAEIQRFLLCLIHPTTPQTQKYNKWFLSQGT